MGCTSSKSIKPLAAGSNSSATQGGDQGNSARGSAKTTDSGISSNPSTGQQSSNSDREEERSSKSSPKGKNKPQSSKGNLRNQRKKGISFVVGSTSTGIIKGHPPKRIANHLGDRGGRSFLGPVDRTAIKHDILKEIVQKQVNAEKAREANRHSVVARQQRRHARAKHVREKKRKLQEECEPWGDVDDNLSDIENDDNFNADDNTHGWESEDDDVMIT